MEEPSRNGTGDLTAGQKALRGLRLHRQGMTIEQAARIAGGTSARQIEAIKGVLKRDPSLEEQLASGDMPLNAAQVAVGYRQHKPVSGRAYGKGDLWLEVANPLMQYLSGWKTRGYKFTHLPPKEAAKRVKVIDEAIEGLQACRADLEQRSVRAQLSMRSH